MKWLTDENFPFASVTTLKNAGLDVVSISEQHPGLDDHHVLDIAHNEARALLTFDRDFGELIFRQTLPGPPAIVYLRFVPRTPIEPAQVVLALLESTAMIEGRFIVLDRDSMRARALPTG